MQKLTLLIALILFGGLVSAQTVRAQDTPPFQAQMQEKYVGRLSAFENYTRQIMEKNQIPGLTIGFVKNETVWIKGFGWADVESKTPADANSAYRLASIQKSMTAAAIMQLVEQKKVDLDAEIQTYVPYFPKKQYPVTVRQLLGHIGGIRAYQAGETHLKSHKNTRQSLAIFANSSLLFEPGTKFAYTSYGYNILGAVIEGASKQPYADYMQQHIWLPLGMNEIHMEDQNPSPNRVRGYRLVSGKIAPSEIIDISSRFAAGGTRAPVGDLLKWMKGLNDGKVLSPSSLDTYYAPMNTKNGKTTGYAMGWFVSQQKSGTVVTHSGGQQETTTYLLNFPAKHFSVALAMNRENAGAGFIIAHRLYEVILNEKWGTGNAGGGL